MDLKKNTLTMKELSLRWKVEPETILRGLHELQITSRQINPKSFERWWVSNGTKRKGRIQIIPEPTPDSPQWNTFFDAKAGGPLWFDLELDVKPMDRQFVNLEHYVELLQDKPLKKTDREALQCFVLYHCHGFSQLEAYKAMEGEAGWSGAIEQRSKRAKVSRAAVNVLSLLQKYGFMTEEQAKGISEELKSRGVQK